MNTYTDAELATMMTDLQSDFVGRKETMHGDAPTKVREAVCAFANDLPDHRRPGVVFLGVHDSGTATGLLADLSRRRFEEEYLPQAFHAEVLAANERSYEERLAAAKMIASTSSPTPTVAGVLVLGSRPRDFLSSAYVQFLRIAGTQWGDPVRDEAELDGPISDLARRIDEKLAAHNHTAVDFTSAPREIRTATYPLPALQQLVRNALMHRTYEGTNNPVRVYWFDDRIEIINPGGPYGVVTAATFGQPGVIDYRNPILAEAMRVLGLVQRFGFGIATARRLLQQAGHPEPEFQVEPNWIRCTVRLRSGPS